jgi:uncharacterized protein YjbI with pentapeptide repeats
VIPELAAAFAGARVVLTKLEHPVAVAETPPVAAEPQPDPRRQAELARIQQRQLEIAQADAAAAEAHRAALAKADFEKAQAAKEEAREARLEKAELAKAEAAKAELAKAELARAELAKAQLAKAQLAKARLAKVELARAEAAKAAAEKAQARREARAQAQADRLEARREALARADAAKAEAARASAHKLELARAAKAEKAEQLKLAKAEARAKAAQREEARLEKLAVAAEAKKREQIARLARAAAHAAPTHEAPATVQQAKLDHRHDRHDQKPQPTALKSRKTAPPPHTVVVHPGRGRQEPPVPPPDTGLMKVSTDPGLSAAERQLARAYQGARAAGVPDAELQVGQQRWLAARSAAAREAPWALHDVYMARIAELNGQAKEAQGGY